MLNFSLSLQVINFIVTYKCCNKSDHKSQDITSNIILQLPVRDGAGRTITSLNHRGVHLFMETIIHKYCDMCGKNTRFKKQKILQKVQKYQLIQHLEKGFHNNIWMKLGEAIGRVGFPKEEI